MIQTKTWPYGTKRRATVTRNNWRPKGLDPRACAAQVVVDETGEIHICLLGCGDDSAQVGDKGTLTFTKGGPTGGYWKFEKDKAE